MGIYDREYVRVKRRGFGQPGGGFGGLGSLGWSVNTWLIAINTAVFFLDGLVFRGMLFNVGAFSTAAATFNVTQQGGVILGLEFWRFITFQFLHANLLHLFFNMFGLYLFGGMVEERLGSKRYAAFYLVCGIFGAILYMALNLLGVLLNARVPGLLTNDLTSPLVGASAGVFGVLLAAAVFYPNMRVSIILLPISMTLRTLVLIYVGLALFNLLRGGQNAGGDAAHVGGAIAGWFFARNSHMLHDFFDVFRRSPPPPDSPRARRSAARRQQTSRRGRAKPARPPRGQPSDAEIDRILAKVATEGLQSLSESEKRALRKASEAKRGG